MSFDQPRQEPLHVLVTGATGFIGSSLVLALRRRGHRVTAFVRDEKGARDKLGAEVSFLPTSVDHPELARRMADFDAVINLAGSPVAQRWTEARKQAMVDSRVGLTERLVAAMGAAAKAPKTLVSASAVGVYGDRGDEELDHASTPGTGFLAQLSLDWEAAAQAATDLGTRVAIVRIGLVLGREGGMLEKTLPAFRAGVGGRLGSGKQWMPWIHLDDIVGIFVRALEDESWRGAYEGSAPNPVRNIDFTRTLGAKLGRPTIFPVPTLALKALFGGAGKVIVASQRMCPVRTRSAGYRFDFEQLDAALDDIVAAHGVSIDAAGNLPSHPYLDERGATHKLEQHTLIDAPLDEVFPFFERAENLGPLTPPSLAFDTQTPGPLKTQAGAEIEHKIKLGPVPMTWLTKILSYEQDRGFVDAQLKGPYSTWYHEHWFEADGEQTRMVDRVHYKVPFGPIGRVANWLFVAPQLRRIFAFRAGAIRLRFGLGGASSTPGSKRGDTWAENVPPSGASDDAASAAE